jgi:UDP-N-acetylglucosamine 2-epimerase (non-hydrolysing)
MTLLAYSNFSLSDSGGIQEESVTLNKKIFVARDETERPEGLLSGNIVIVGSGESRVRENLLREISESAPVRAIAVNLDNNPFGGGDAATRIVALIIQTLA